MLVKRGKAEEYKDWTSILSIISFFSIFNSYLCIVFIPLWPLGAKGKGSFLGNETHESFPHTQVGESFPQQGQLNTWFPALT